MFKVAEFWGELKDLVQSIKADIETNKGMWLAYAFLVLGILMVIVVNFLLMSGTYSVFVALERMDPEFFFDNPVPLFVYGALIYLTFDVLKSLHEAYLDLRKIIKKGNLKWVSFFYLFFFIFLVFVITVIRNFTALNSELYVWEHFINIKAHNMRNGC